jgi:hypothetical protein
MLRRKGTSSSLTIPFQIQYSQSSEGLQCLHLLNPLQFHSVLWSEAFCACGKEEVNGDADTTLTQLKCRLCSM